MAAYWNSLPDCVFPFPMTIILPNTFNLFVVLNNFGDRDDHIYVMCVVSIAILIRVICC